MRSKPEQAWSANPPAGRKFNAYLRIASQLIEYFPPSMVDVATALILRDGGSESLIERLDGHFRLTDEEKRVMRGELTGPTPEGAPFWAMFRHRKEGAIRQKLNLTLGPAELWAFSTTAEDGALRERLYGTLGPRLARKVRLDASREARPGPISRAGSPAWRRRAAVQVPVGATCSAKSSRSTHQQRIFWMIGSERGLRRQSRDAGTLGACPARRRVGSASAPRRSSKPIRSRNA